jgi:hypothetical protein
MKAGDWYTGFGTQEDQHDTMETYYHVVEVTEDRVFIDEYNFYTHFKRLVKMNKKPRSYPVKRWLEENIKNNVYQVQKESLPFYLRI